MKLKVFGWKDAKRKREKRVGKEKGEGGDDKTMERIRRTIKTRVEGVFKLCKVCLSPV
jgi:hypothetical protein